MGNCLLFISVFAVSTLKTHLLSHTHWALRDAKSSTVSKTVPTLPFWSFQSRLGDSGKQTVRIVQGRQSCDGC